MPGGDRRPFLLRVGADGTRSVSWRMRLLIWLLPVLFLGAAVLLAGAQGLARLTMVPGQGEVVLVRSWPGDGPLDRGVILYAPVFRYVWSDGKPTEASAGLAHADWDFPVGSLHPIRFDPGEKRDVRLDGAHNWVLAGVIGLLGAVLILPAGLAELALRRWRNGGAAT